MSGILEGLLVACLLGLALAATGQAADADESTPLRWRALHLFCSSTEGAETLGRMIEEQLVPLGVNAIVIEVDYNFQFQSHPEISQGTLDKATARRLAAVCHARGIRLIPLINCLGHQSWAESTFTLLREHPEFDETPDIPLDNPDIYCRSWCPLHPDVNPLVFDLMDELVDAFQTHWLHVGLDEVFLLGSDQCPRCRGRDRAELFAKAVNDYHAHLKAKGVKMLMWGDRLIDAAEMDYGTWEASGNDTARAVDMIPRDIIICDWHYEPRAEYPSVPYFQAKGFDVLVSPWKRPAAAEALLRYSRETATDRFLGVLFTGWSGGDGGKGILAGLRGEITGDVGGAGEAAVLMQCLASGP